MVKGTWPYIPLLLQALGVLRSTANFRFTDIHFRWTFTGLPRAIAFCFPVGRIKSDHDNNLKQWGSGPA